MAKSSSRGKKSSSQLPIPGISETAWQYSFMGKIEYSDSELIRKINQELLKITAQAINLSGSYYQVGGNIRDLVIKKLFDMDMIQLWDEQEIKSLGERTTNLEREMWQIKSTRRDLEYMMTPLPTDQHKSKILSQAGETIHDLRNSFDDKVIRLGLMMKLKDQMRELWSFARNSDDKHLKYVASMLHDAIKDVYAEELTLSQVDVIVEVLSVIRKQVIEVKDVELVHDKLVSGNLEYMPTFKEEKMAISD